MSAEDEIFMKKALELSECARVRAPPNPWVGCVIADEGKIVGEGFTQKVGGPHAEVTALRQAQGRTRGATAYVTLEPCSHFGRTPPCVNALIDAGIKRLVMGIQDPDERVKGKGAAKLRAMGIQVTEGILADRISKSLAPYLYHRKTGLPYCLVKAAASIDGRVAAEDGTSQWISSSEARLDCHKLRAESQAILIGAGTARYDLPALTVRDVAEHPPSPPLRVVLDSSGTVLPKGPLFDTTLAPTLFITTSTCPEEVKENWQNHGVSVEIVSQAKNGIGVDIKEVLILLGKKGILQLLVEGGGKILGSFLESEFADRVVLYLGGRILGSRGIPLFATNTIGTMEESPELNLLETTTLGNTVRLDYNFKKDDYEAG